MVGTPINSQDLQPLKTPSENADPSFLKQIRGAYLIDSLGGFQSGTPNGGAISTTWTKLSLQGGLVSYPYQGIGPVFIKVAELAWETAATVGPGDTVMEVRVVPAGTSTTAANTTAIMLGTATAAKRATAGGSISLYQNPDYAASGADHYDVLGKILEFQVRFTGTTVTTTEVTGIHMRVRLQGPNASDNNRKQV